MRDDRFSKTTPSLASYYENLEVEEWIQSVAGVLDQGWNDQYAFRSSQPSSKHVALSPLLTRPFLTSPFSFFSIQKPALQSRVAEAPTPLRVPNWVQHLFRARAFPSWRAILCTLPRTRRASQSHFSIPLLKFNVTRRHQIHTSRALSPH